MTVGEYSDGDQLQKFSFKTSLNEYNEHCTNIVCIKHRIHLNESKMDPEDYKIVMDLLNKIYTIDYEIYKAIGKQNARRRKLKQTRVANAHAVKH